MGNRKLGKDEFENLSDTAWKHGKDQTPQGWAFSQANRMCTLNKTHDGENEEKLTIFVIQLTFLSICYGPGVVAGPWDMAVNKIDRNLSPRRANNLVQDSRK